MHQLDAYQQPLEAKANAKVQRTRGYGVSARQTSPADSM
jgi:hypothetical protein